MNDFKVCVRCMTYNQASYIVDALNGFCMQQTSFPYVCCILDDASTDGEQEVIREYLEQNFDLEDKSVAKNEDTDDYVLTFARHKENHNCFFAVLYLKYNHYSIWNRKYQYISQWEDVSTYIANCEGDDYWIAPDKLEKQVHYLDCHLECVLTYSNAILVQPNSEIKWINSIIAFVDTEINNLSLKWYSNPMKALLVNGNVLHTASVCYRNYDNQWISFQNEIPFKLVMGDKPKWLYYSSLGNFKCFHSFMSAYRVLPESASHSGDYSKMLRHRDNGEEISKFFNEYFSVGLSEKKLCKLYLVAKCRAKAKFSKELFLTAWKQLLKEYPIVAFNVKLDVISFIRIVLDKSI